MKTLDTTAAAQRVQDKLLRAVGPSERVRRVVAMSEEAREIARAGIRARHPEWSDARTNHELLQRLYGADLVERAWGPAPE